MENCFLPLKIVSSRGKLEPPTFGFEVHCSILQLDFFSRDKKVPKLIEIRDMCRFSEIGNVSLDFEQTEQTKQTVVVLPAL